MSQLHPTIEKFYLSMLNYAGMCVDDNTIKNLGDKFGDITIDNKFLTLPYFNNLKNPNNKIIFHPLNENYVTPENTVFDLYKRRLTLELNLKLSYLVINLISIAADIQIQQKIKSSKLIEIISEIGEVDHVLLENFTNLIKASKKVNSEAFLFDIYLKKNGELDNTPFAAIGKLNFTLINELNNSLNDKTKEYKVFGFKLRKKDLLALLSIFNIIFPDYGNKLKYSDGTDNRVFRYLTILLKTSYMVSDRINELCKLLEELKEPHINTEDCISDISWSTYLEDLNSLVNEIRIIPNQLDLAIEASHKLAINESKVANVPIEQDRQTFNPVVAQQAQPPQVQPQHIQPQQVQPQQVQPPSAEDIIRGIAAPMYPPQGQFYPPQQMLNPYMNPYNQPNMYPNQYPAMMQQHPAMFQTPMWAQREMMQNQQPQFPMQQMPPNYPQQMQPGMMMPNQFNQPSGLQINPMLMSSRPGFY